MDTVMERPDDRRMRWAPLAFAVLAAVLAFLSSVNASPTDDEPTYAGQGAYLVRTGDFRAPVLLWQPPLGLYVTSAALPLVTLPADAFATRPPSDSLTALGDQLLFESPSAPEAVLRASRFPVVLVMGLLAALATWLAARLAGSTAGALSGMLVAASPMLYAHGGLATTDAVATAAALLAVAPLALAAAAPATPWTIRRAALAGAALGVALLAKHTALALVPITTIAAFLLARRGGAHARRAVACSIIALVAAGVVVWAGYGFHTGVLVADDSKGDLAAKMGPGAAWASWCAHNLPVPAPRYWQSLVFQAAKQHDRLYFQYFGELRKVGWWTYFPVVTLGKATLGSIALVAAAAWTVRRRRPDAAEWVLLAAFAVPFGMAVVSRHNLGVRHVLPAIAPLFVLAAVRLGRDWIGTQRALATVGAMAVLHLAEGIGAAPDALAWWNLAAGGTQGGWRVATGSNADWGQGLWRLRDEVRARGLEDVHVIASNGPRSAVDRIEREGIRVYRDGTRRAPLPDRGWLAVSTSAWRRGDDDPITDAAPDLFVAGCYRLYRLPLRGRRTP